MSDQDNDNPGDRQADPEMASDASGSPPPNDAPEPSPKRRRGRAKLRVIESGEPSEDEPEPDDDEDPVTRPASPGRRATWRVKAFVNSMYRDPNFPWPNVEWRKKTLKDEETQVIDVGDDENRMAALALRRHLRSDLRPRRRPLQISSLPTRPATASGRDPEAALAQLHRHVRGGSGVAGSQGAVPHGIDAAGATDAGAQVEQRLRLPQVGGAAGRFHP